MQKLFRSRWYKTSISVVMPCFNAERYVAEAIGSILGQTFDDVELVIVDDGSTDGMVDIAADFADKRIRLRRHGSNLENYSDWNNGINEATAKYIAMMEADDIALPAQLETQYAYLEKHRHVGAIGTTYSMIDGAGRKLHDNGGPINHTGFKIALLRNNCMLQSSIMVRSPLMRKDSLLYDTEYRYSADHDFVWRCSMLFPIFNLSDRLLLYRVHKHQISNACALEQRGLSDAIRAKRFARFGIDNNTMVLINRMINGDILIGDELLEVRYVYESILVDNKEMGVYAWYRLHHFFQSILDRATLRLSASVAAGNEPTR